MKKQLRAKGLLGVPMGFGELETLLDNAVAVIEDRHPAFTFACANPHSLVVAQRDRAFFRALRACSAVVADGVGVTMAARVTGADVGPRITGADFFLGLMARANRRGGRVFFLGSSEGVLSEIAVRARRDYPRLHIDTLSPPFGGWDEATNDEILARIRDARPDILWVGMTAPKQEKWVHANREQLDVPVIGSIGAVFDFYAGTVQRAPDWICDAGLEWLYRLVREPSRLWRRTLLSAPIFLMLVARERWLAAQNITERVV